MKILNLDKFSSKEKRKLVLKGVSYEIEDMTVDNFIITTKATDAITENDSLAVQVEATAAMILRSVPAISREALGGLPLESLQAIVSFIRGDEDVEGVEVTEEGEAGK